MVNETLGRYDSSLEGYLHRVNEALASYFEGDIGGYRRRRQTKG